jgi:hypothetical protein
MSAGGPAPWPFLLHAGEERLDDAELDVRLEQGQADLAELGLDLLLGQLGQARETVPGCFEPFGEGVERGMGVPAQQRVRGRTRPWTAQRAEPGGPVIAPASRRLFPSGSVGSV